MELQTVLAVCVFAAVSSITPGPNNLMLLASGVRHGFRATVPHLLGITCGFMVLMMAAGLGLGALFERWPALHVLLRWVGIAYLLLLAWRLWRAGAPGTHAAQEQPQTAGRPLGFVGAALFQWVNPKAWVMALGAIAGFMGAGSGPAAALLMAGVCGAVNLPCITVWAYGGARLSRWLSRPAARQGFNSSMAALLVLSIYPMLA